MESPKGNAGEKKKTSKPIIHYCGFLQLKMQISRALDQEASQDGREHSRDQKSACAELEGDFSLLVQSADRQWPV